MTMIMQFENMQIRLTFHTLIINALKNKTIIFEKQNYSIFT